MSLFSLVIFLWVLVGEVDVKPPFVNFLPYVVANSAECIAADATTEDAEHPVPFAVLQHMIIYPAGVQHGKNRSEHVLSSSALLKAIPYPLWVHVRVRTADRKSVV